MRVKLDENIGRRCLELLREAGHEVATVTEQGMCSAPDGDILRRCREEDRCLVTLDLDFGNPLRFRPSTFAGIAVLRLPSRPSYEDLLGAVRTLIAGLKGDGIHGRLWIVQRGRIRQYLPEQ